jgi:hypothetical protein
MTYIGSFGFVSAANTADIYTCGTSDRNSSIVPLRTDNVTIIGRRRRRRLIVPIVFELIHWNPLPRRRLVPSVLIRDGHIQNLMHKPLIIDPLINTNAVPSPHYPKED